jgi:hypothetical protein
MCHLHSLRCAGTATVGVTAGAVSTDHLDTGVGTQPVGEVHGLPTVQDVQRPIRHWTTAIQIRFWAK